MWQCITVCPAALPTLIPTLKPVGPNRSSRRGELLKAIADYCSTSAQMIEADYCGTLTLSDLTVFQPGASKLSESMVVPTGFEDYLTPENIRQARRWPC